eukprot:5519751-Prymnesium_polylepis.1
MEFDRHVGKLLRGHEDIAAEDAERQVDRRSLRPLARVSPQVLRDVHRAAGNVKVALHPPVQRRHVKRLRKEALWIDRRRPGRHPVLIVQARHRGIAQQLEDERRLDGASIDRVRKPDDGEAWLAELAVRAAIVEFEAVEQPIQISLPPHTCVGHGARALHQHPVPASLQLASRAVQRGEARVARTGRDGVDVVDEHEQDRRCSRGAGRGVGLYALACTTQRHVPSVSYPD